jgi:hypothetical protein
MDTGGTAREPRCRLNGIDETRVKPDIGALARALLPGRAHGVITGYRSR